MHALIRVPFAVAISLILSSATELFAQASGATGPVPTRPPAISPPPAPAQQSGAQPETSGVSLGFALDLSVEFGGDDFLKVFFTDGTSQQIKAGQGGTAAIGGILRPRENSPLSLRGTLGIKYVTTAADNANIRFTRIPIELVGGYDFPNGMRAGAGLVYHANNQFSGDGFVPDQSFDASAGFTAEIGYKAVALTYTALSYPIADGQSFNGGSIGVQLLWTPKRKRQP
jgi:hypothetical protein